MMKKHQKPQRQKVISFLINWTYAWHKMPVGGATLQLHALFVFNYAQTVKFFGRVQQLNTRQFQALTGASIYLRKVTHYDRMIVMTDMQELYRAVYLYVSQKLLTVAAFKFSLSLCTFIAAVSVIAETKKIPLIDGHVSSKETQWALGDPVQVHNADYASMRIFVETVSSSSEHLLGNVLCRNCMQF